MFVIFFLLQTLVVPIAVWKSIGITNSFISICWTIFCQSLSILFTHDEARLFLHYAFFMNATALHNTCAILSAFLDGKQANQWIVTPEFVVTVPTNSVTINLTQNLGNEKRHGSFLLRTITSIMKSNQSIYKIFQRRFRFIRLYKSYAFLGLYLLFISFAAMQQRMFFFALYMTLTSATSFILAFGTIGRHTWSNARKDSQIPCRFDFVLPVIL